MRSFSEKVHQNYPLNSSRYRNDFRMCFRCVYKLLIDHLIVIHDSWRMDHCDPWFKKHFYWKKFSFECFDDICASISIEIVLIYVWMQNSHALDFWFQYSRCEMSSIRVLFSENAFRLYLSLISNEANKTFIFSSPVEHHACFLDTEETSLVFLNGS